MESKPAPRCAKRQGGFALVAITALVTVLLATGLAFMRWNVDEAVQSAQATAAMQAYYLGQLGIVEQGFQYLRTLPAAHVADAAEPCCMARMSRVSAGTITSTLIA